MLLDSAQDTVDAAQCEVSRSGGLAVPTRCDYVFVSSAMLDSRSFQDLPRAPAVLRRPERYVASGCMSRGINLSRQSPRPTPSEVSNLHPLRVIVPKCRHDFVVSCGFRIACSCIPFKRGCRLSSSVQDLVEPPNSAILESSRFHPQCHQGQDNGSGIRTVRELSARR